MTTLQLLVRDNIAFLRQGIALLEQIDEHVYTRTAPPLYESNVGAHFRHILDHYRCLIADVRRGSVDYDLRARGSAMEQSRSAALEAMQQIVPVLESLAASVPPDLPVAVRMNSSATSRQEKLQAYSTLARELQFLVSHTVHHYALIAFVLRSEGIDVPSGFGLSPATLEYLDGRASHAAC